MMRFRHTLSSQLFVATVFLSVLATSCGSSTTSSGPPPLPVDLLQLESETHEFASEFVGNLEASERVELRPQIDGRIIQILVAEGEAVDAGSPIFLLNSEQTQAEVDSAISAVNAREAELKATEASRDRVAAQFRLAQIEADRYIELADDGAVSFEIRDQFVSDLEVEQANLDTAEEEVVAARKRLQEVQSQLAAVQVNLDYKQVTSPIAGIVGDIPLRVGDVVSVGQSLTTITQNSQLEFNINVPVNQLPNLKIGLPVELIDTNSNEVVTTGSISFINPRINQSNQTVLAKIVFNNTMDLKDDQFMRARVIWDTAPGILVPTSAVSILGSQAFVYVADEITSETGETQQVARQVPISLGNMQDQSYQVTSGLEPGDRLITSRLLDLVDGLTISEVPPAEADDSAATLESKSDGSHVSSLAP